jgi:ElaB/YqjD/DUF883 family membrane-anchored ribosome-binding protein
MPLQEDPPELEPGSPKKEKELLRNVNDIKENVVNLAQNLKDVGRERATVAADYVRDQVENIKETSAEAMEEVEERIKSRPAQSLAIAFAAGALMSYLFSRRSA